MFLTLNSFDEHIHSIVTTKAPEETVVNIVNLSALLKCCNKLCVSLSWVKEIANGNLVKLVKLLEHKHLELLDRQKDVCVCVDDENVMNVIT